MELPGPLVKPAWLAERLGEPGLVIADVRWRLDGTARVAYDTGHLPGAVFFDIDTDLATAPSFPGGRHPLPAPDAFAERMGEAGIGDADAVAAYDDAAGSVASRLWWMLTAIGHRAAVLDGGLEAWRGPLSTEPTTRSRAHFSTRPWPAEQIADASEVERALADRSAVVLDARAAERYRGEVEPID